MGKYNKKIKKKMKLSIMKEEKRKEERSGK
jgi:hypothetical protein